MLPSPRRSVSASAIAPPAYALEPQVDDDDDEDGWQGMLQIDEPELMPDMPVVRSGDNPLGLDDEDKLKFHYRPPDRLDPSDPVVTGNATGTHLTTNNDTSLADDWRDKLTLDESDYTRLQLDEDNESEEVAMRTKYLFDEDKAMTPLSQMQATKTLLTEGQRIAYVGLCALVARRMVQDAGRGWEGTAQKKLSMALKGKGKAVDVPVVESGKIWSLKIMARLYQHMELEAEEQRMIESLAEHGVDPSDLVPALTTTHTVKNPEFDPVAKMKAETEAETIREEEEDSIAGPSSPASSIRSKAENPFGDDEDDELPMASSSIVPKPFHVDDDEGDLGAVDTPTTSSAKLSSSAQDETTPKATPMELSSDTKLDPTVSSALPGVTTSLSNTDEMVTLDIRWTVLCDLFLVLIADSVYDSRSRVFLEAVATAFDLTWMDVTRFEKRVTDALEIQEGVEQLEQDTVIEGRRKKGMKKRYAMMGLATLGGGLVIGLSAGLMAPLIGAGLGAAFATVGISGTTGFLAGASGAAVITTGGVLTGSSIAGKGMARRTREVRTFEFRPLHNNKRVNCIITLGGFMAGKMDDVRLPFSVLDPIVGDVFSVLWEPEMMNEMGNALKILTTEVLTQVGQTVLSVTLMTALMSALQWPLILTKLGYLIDNPWSNALDRCRAAGLVLADTLMNRHAGVRPITLIGYSLGSRVIFYALAELARCKAFGIVQDVILFGTTVTASRSTWLEVRSVVAGRFVNGYATSDWMLGYLFRATSGGLNTVAGLRPVEGVPQLENVDVTEIITGHMSYRSCMPLLLAKVGLPTTADYFDEPEDPDADMSQQERTVITAEQEEALRNPPKKILGLFPRRQKANSVTSNSKPGSGSSSPAARHSTEKAPVEEYDDDDLPPPEEEVVKAEEAAVAKIPATAGFDFKAISEVLGKDIDVEALPAPRPQPATAANVDALKKAGDAPPLERSESAPPPLQDFPSSVSEIPTSTSSWTSSSSSTSPSNTSNPSLPSFTNEWSTPAVFPPLRSAPPARPHPANLFTSSTKKTENERWATENPW